MIHAESLAAVAGESRIKNSEFNFEGTLRSPGLLAKHYSPKAKLVILNWSDDVDLRSQLSTFNVEPATIHVIVHTKIPAGENFADVSVMPHDAEAFARALYAEWHQCDEAGAALIVMEALPQEDAWQAIADRVARAEGKGHVGS